MTTNFTKGIGRLVLDRYSAEEHFNGTNFRHKSNQIDNNPPIVINNVSTNTVSSSLSEISSYIVSAINNGIGFISIPDGYDAWHAANGTINFDNTVPSLDSLLNPIFSAIYNNTTVPAPFDRVRFGGVIFIKAGTYIVKNTINIPPGIIILGEGYGTKIINATGLDTSTLPCPLKTTYSISNASNTTPIQITTLSTNSLQNGDTVVISGIKGNTAANGTFKVSIIDSTNFTLDGSAGNGAYQFYSVINATNTTPIQITTSGSNSIINGDTVTITGVTGNTAANGIFSVIFNFFFPPNSFDLKGSSGNGGYSAGGTVYTGFVTFARPVFEILRDNNRSNNDAAIDSNLFMFGRESKLMNMVVADNFVEPTEIGDVLYKLPQNISMPADSTMPLIKQNPGSNFTCDNVFFNGRVSLSGSTVNAATSFAIDVSGPIISSGGSLLKVNNCFIDGFSVPVRFFGSMGSLDFVTITNSKIRAYGWLYGDNTSVQSNSFMLASDCNTLISNNHLYGDGYVIQSIVDFDATMIGLNTVPNLQSKSKAIAGPNNIVIDKTQNVANQTFQFFYNDLAFSDTLDGYVTIAGKPILIDSTPYTIDCVNTEGPFVDTFLVSTLSLSITIILPPVSLSANRRITIKDATGNANPNNIILQRFNPLSETIEGALSDYTISTNFKSVTLAAFIDGDGWVFV